MAKKNAKDMEIVKNILAILSHGGMIPPVKKRSIPTSIMVDPMAYGAVVSNWIIVPSITDDQSGPVRTWKTIQAMAIRVRVIFSRNVFIFFVGF